MLLYAIYLIKVLYVLPLIVGTTFAASRHHYCRVTASRLPPYGNASAAMTLTLLSNLINILISTISVKICLQHHPTFHSSIVPVSEENDAPIL